MKHIRSLTAVGVVAATAFALVVPSASASTTTVRRTNATGAAYSGNVQATLIQPVVTTTSLGSATCDTGTIDATVASTGANLNVSVYSFHNGSTPTTCPNSAGGTSTTTPVGLPWNGGNVTYAPVSGGHDGTFTVNSLQVTSITSGWFGSITCTYQGSGTGGAVTMDYYNPDNANRPVTTISQAEAKANGVTLNKVSGSFLCPSTATYSAAFQILGETTAGSGVYNQKLYLTS
jgi:hypothetical protein